MVYTPCMTTHPTTAGSPSGGPAVGVCTHRHDGELCGAPRDRSNSSYCKKCRNEMAADYRKRARPRPTTEERVCALEECDVVFIWHSTHPQQVCCSKSHTMTRRWRLDHPKTEDEVLEAGQLRCSKCGVVKSALAFSPSVREKSWHACRECQRAYDRRWASENKEKTSAATRRSRAARLLRKYGACSDDIDVIAGNQGGLCIYCDQPAGAKGFHIEHDHEMHEAGKPSFRGLSCHGCNVGIGSLGDDPQRIREIADRLDLLKRELRDELGRRP